MIHGMATPERKDADNRSQGGYDCEFVTPPPAYFQTECSICLLVFHSPHLASCCGHNFCKVCIEGIQRDEKSCPLCNSEEFILTYNRTHDVAIKQLEVYCTHRSIGCEWRGKLEMLNHHLNVDPEPEKQLEGCAFVEVQCCYDGCRQSLQRRLIAQHQWEECGQRPFSCDYCHEYNSTNDDVLFNHLPVCECFPVSCPNGDCSASTVTIERRHLKRHLDEDCPFQEVECEFKYAGCKTKVPRKDMPEHLKESVAHMTLLARQNRELTAKVLEKDETIKRLSDMVEENRREMKDVKKLVEKGMKQRMKTAEGHGGSKREMEQRVRGLEQKQDATSTSLEKLYCHLQIAPVQIFMTNFEQHKRANDQWFSNGFYTHPQGYKICLKVYANGSSGGKGTHMSCGIYLMRGEFDDHLKWPFQGVITIQLLNQREDNDHHTDSFTFNDQTPARNAARVTGGERAASGWGKPRFIPHSNLDHNTATNCQYLMNNCLHFRLKVKLK